MEIKKQVNYNLYNKRQMGFDMKWTMLAGMIALTTGCCCTNTAVVYQPVRVVPVKRVVAVVPIAPVVEPVIVDYVEPVDVTTTTIDFY